MVRSAPLAHRRHSPSRHGGIELRRRLGSTRSDMMGGVVAVELGCLGAVLINYRIEWQRRPDNGLIVS